MARTEAKRKVNQTALSFKAFDLWDSWGDKHPELPRTGSHLPKGVVEKLDAVPVFHIVGTHDKLMVPTNDSLDSDERRTGEACGCWYFDHVDARLQLSGLQRANAEGVTLAIEPTPLGTEESKKYSHRVRK